MWPLPYQYVLYLYDQDNVFVSSTFQKKLNGRKTSNRKHNLMDFVSFMFRHEANGKNINKIFTNDKRDFSREARKFF